MTTLASLRQFPGSRAGVTRRIERAPADPLAWSALPVRAQLYVAAVMSLGASGICLPL